MFTVSSYVEWSRVIFLMEGFIASENAASEIGAKLPHAVGSKRPVSYSAYDVFGSGDGRIAEIFVQWMLDEGITLEEVHGAFGAGEANEGNQEGSDEGENDMEQDEPEAEAEATKANKTSSGLSAFVNTCTEYFPMSSKKDLLICHLAWEFMHRWSKHRKSLALFTDGGLLCLQWLAQPSLQHRLSILVWTTFLNKASVEAVNLTENRSSTRCERELGFEENQLPLYLDTVTSLLRILVDTSDIDLVAPNQIDVSYDDVSLTVNMTSSSGISGGRRLHLMDHLSGKMRSCDPEVIAIQYQFVAVANAIWSFGIDFIK